MISSPAKKIEQSADLAEKSPSGRRPMIVGAFLFFATLATLVVGGWGLMASLGTQAPPAGIGDTVEVPGGLLRVDGVTPESMAPMQTKKYERSGMSMSANVPDMTPEGYKRFNVDVTLAAEYADLNYSAKDFRITGEGVDQVTPLRHELDPGLLPEGSAIQGIMVFQVPKDAKNLMLTFGDSRQPVALGLKPGEGGNSNSGADSGDGHSHEH